MDFNKRLVCKACRLFFTTSFLSGGIFRISCYAYTDEAYEYQGETYKGENFKVFEAEIIGTENMYLEDRLKIHQAVLSYLDAGATIEEAEIYVKTKFKHIFG